MFHVRIPGRNFDDSLTKWQRRVGMSVVPGYNVFQVFDAGVFEALYELLDLVTKLAIYREKESVKSAPGDAAFKRLTRCTDQSLAIVPYAVRLWGLKRIDDTTPSTSHSEDGILVLLYLFNMD